MKKRGDGRERLIESAKLEFGEFGFEGTNTNAIAKRAGYAPQAFYRHFENKTAIFLAVYQEWANTEMRDALLAKTEGKIADVLIHHHKEFRLFRHSLRYLTVSDSGIGKARAQARLRQMDALAQKISIHDTAFLLATILKIERLCDAIVDGEFEACGIDDEAAFQQLILLLSDLHAE
jgi:AcrR family transcriptional regulator